MIPSQNVFRTLIDSGANCHLISEVAALSFKVPIIPFPAPLTIHTAEKGATLISYGYISLGESLSHLYVVPNITQSILSVSLLQKVNIGTIFDPINKTCSFSTSFATLLTCPQDRSSSLYFCDLQELYQALSSC